MMVRCLDNTLQRDVLVVDRLYEVIGEEHDCFILFGLGRFSKHRFEEPDKIKEIVGLSEV